MTENDKLWKCVWMDGTTKVLIAYLISRKGKFVELKTKEGQTFIINKSNLISLFEYTGDAVKNESNG